VQAVRLLVAKWARVARLLVASWAGRWGPVAPASSPAIAMNATPMKIAVAEIVIAFRMFPVRIATACARPIVG